MTLHVINIYLSDRTRWYAKEICRSIAGGNDIPILFFRQPVDQIEVLSADNQKSGYAAIVRLQSFVSTEMLTQGIDADNSGYVLRILSVFIGYSSVASTHKCLRL
jgi:hypothetical protein